MRVVSDLTAAITKLERTRDRLREDVGRQQELLANLQQRVTQVRCARLTEVIQDFDEQLAGLEKYSPYLVERHAGLITRLRDALPERAEAGEQIDLRAIVKSAQAES